MGYIDKYGRPVEKVEGGWEPTMWDGTKRVLNEHGVALQTAEDLQEIRSIGLDNDKFFIPFVKSSSSALEAIQNLRKEHKGTKTWKEYGGVITDTLKSAAEDMRDHEMYVDRPASKRPPPKWSAPKPLPKPSLTRKK